MAGIQIGIASETKAFKQGIESGLIEPLEDAVEALDDLGKSKGPDKLEDGLEDAQKASKELEREVKDTADTIEKEFKKSYAQMKQSAADGTDGAKESLNDFKREANSTAKESAASFDGSAESIVDAFQETAANAFEGFGPAGALAGIAAAAGIGLVSAAFTQAGEDAEKLEEKVETAFDQMIESQSKYIAQEFTNEAIKEIINDTDRMNEATETANTLGLDRATIIRAMAGDQAALSAVNTIAAASAETLSEKIAKQKDETGRASETDLRRLESLAKVSGKLQDQSGIYATAVGRYEDYRQAVTDSTFANDISLKSVDKLSDGVGRLGSGLAKLPANVKAPVIEQAVVPAPDTSRLDAAIRRHRAMNVEVRYVDRNGKRIY